MQLVMTESHYNSVLLLYKEFQSKFVQLWLLGFPERIELGNSSSVSTPPPPFHSPPPPPTHTHISLQDSVQVTMAILHWKGLKVLHLFHSQQ